MNASGNNETQLTNTQSSVSDSEPSWFPNGDKIAFRRDELDIVFRINIWVLTLNENGQPTGEQQLTTSSGDDIAPALSPNGKLIAFASNRITPGNPTSDFEIYVMKAAPESPTNVPKQLTKNTVADQYPDWSPSGKQIVFESYREGSDGEIVVMNADGTRQKLLTNNSFNDLDPVFSPSGTRIAFESSRGLARDIWRMRTDGSRQVNLTESNTIEANPSWQPMP